MDGVVTAGQEPLDEEFRGPGQNRPPLGSQGAGEEHDRGHEEDDQGVGQDQRAILGLAPDKARQGVVQEGPLALDDAHGLAASSRAVRKRGGGSRAPLGKCSRLRGWSWKAAKRSAWDKWRV